MVKKKDLRDVIFVEDDLTWTEKKIQKKVRAIAKQRGEERIRVTAKYKSYILTKNCTSETRLRTN